MQSYRVPGAEDGELVLGPVGALLGSRVGATVVQENEVAFMHGHKHPIGTGHSMTSLSRQSGC